MTTMITTITIYDNDTNDDNDTNYDNNNDNDNNDADMEFVTNFTRSHFIVNFFTPKYSVNYNIFYFYFTKISFY